MLKINYYGYLTPFGGYGIANLNWVKYLSRQGITVYPHSKFTPDKMSQEWSILDDEMKEILERPFELCDIGIIETTPFDFHFNQSKLKIANTMAETDEIGPEWVEACNGMDYVIVPNHFYRQVFQSSGVTSPIRVISHGIDTDLFKYFDRTTRKRQEFVFGSCGYLNERKGVYELIQAFASEFDENEPVKLKLHSTNPEMGYYKELKDKRIEITTELWDFQKVNEFYQDLDCFVFPSKAEGIGYPPREAMATGLPTILTNFSGLEDVARFGYPLLPSGFEKVNPVKQQPGNWAKIDVRDLMRMMRFVYENKRTALMWGYNASANISKYYSWKACSLQLADFLYEVQDSQNKHD